MGLRERRQREKQARRKQILDAARTLLFEKGLAETSISQIAKIAELGVGTIYFYYQSKEEIFAGLQEEGLELLLTQIRQSYEAVEDPVKKLKSAALAVMRFSSEHKDYFDVINYFLSTPEVVFGPKLKIRVDRHGGKIFSLVAELVEDGMAAGVFKTVNPRRFAIMFWALLHGLIQYKKLQSTIFEGEAFAGVYTDAVDHLIASLACEKKCDRV